MKLWKRKQTLRDNLQRVLPAMAAEYFEAGRAAFAEGSTWTEMHQFRLQTKRFRYTLEIFQAAYGPGLEARIEGLRFVQTELGDINDSVVTAEMLGDVAGTESTRTELGGKADRRTEKLRKYWTTQFDGPGQYERWARYLGVYACRPKPLPRTRRLTAPESEASGN